MEERMSSFCIKSRNHRNGVGGGTGTKCGRWNPTAEQVKVLTDLFRSGLRTPSTDQIQKISTQLSFYGKIESKNVFYWFQNHKARERQKRRKISVDLDHHHKDLNNIIRSDNVNPIDFFEGNKGCEQERVMETLQLFPLNSFEGTKTDKRRFHNVNGNGREGCNTASFPSYSCGAEMDHPPLDLRLSFL